MLDVGQYDKFEKEFSNHVIKERQRYDAIYKLIEEYILQNNTHNSKLKYDNRIILGGSSSVHMLLNVEKTHNDYTYTLFSESAFPHANAIANMIAAYVGKYMKQDPEIFVSLKTVIQNTKYTIFVDGRHMIHINNLQKMSSNIDTFDLIKPVEKISGNNKFYLLPPHFYLVDFYRTLYLPNYAGNWQDILQKEGVLYDSIKGDLKATIGSKDKKIDRRSILLKHIFENFLLNNNKIAVIDEAAMALYETHETHNTIDNVSKFVILCESSIKEFIEIVKKSVRAFMGRDILMNYKSQNINILNDRRLKRYIVKLEDREILQIYNSAHYDLIPVNTISYKSGTINIANPFVIMRFLLVEIYVINVILTLKKIDEKFAEHKLQTIMKNVIKLRAGIKKSDIFQNSSDMYIGKFIDDITYEQLKIKKMKQDKKISFDYYPQKYMIDNSKYRQINFP